MLRLARDQCEGAILSRRLNSCAEQKRLSLPKPYDIALKDSTRFLFEFDPTRHAEFQKKFEAAAKYPPGQDIRSKISPELLAWLRKNMFTMLPDARGGTGERVVSSTASFVTSRGGSPSIWPHRHPTAKLPPRTDWIIILWITPSNGGKRSVD